MKKGSALLVVLGMLAFMLISAVAFSAYMRYARLPSSFLRRSSASRLLAKAALAEAIDEIDAAIGNNPHPGLGTQSPRRGAGSLNADKNGLQNEDMRTRNYWRHRIYIGTNELHQADETVSTLTLEGLAYIPPALVNEARYYSRLSQAGMWKNLGFDSGRYAFCAIDVSDMFDVNVLSAKIPRNSSSCGKISLAYLFEGDDHTSSGGQNLSLWDDKFLKEDAQVRQMSASEAAVKDQDMPPANAQFVPFVSVADLNLAINDKKPLGWESPFCKFLDSGGDFYTGVGATDPTGPGADKVKRMSFVTDSVFPQPSAMLASKATDLCDLSNFDEQPFESAELTMENFPVERLVDNPTKESARRIANKASFFGLAALYDYLDANNVPVSLALPTTERAPMICGIGNVNMGSATLTLQGPEKKEEALNEQQGSRTMRRTTTYKIDAAPFTQFFDAGSFRAVMAYPFRRGVDLLDATAPFKFTLEGQLSVFFAREGAMNFHSGGGLLSPAKNLFTDDAKVVDGVFRMPLKFDDFKSAMFDAVQTDDNAVRSSDTVLGDDARTALSDYLEQNPLLTVVEEWQQTKTVSPSGAVSWDPAEPPDGSVASADSALRIVTPGGTAEQLGSFLNGREEKLVVCSAIWLRVRNDDNKTVDLVPASLADDDALNDANNANAAIIADIVGKTPLMLTTANAGNALTVSSEGLKGQTTPIPLDFSMNVQCIDPRWNWAPEHWYSSANPVTENTWLTDVRAFVNTDGRDRDIFLSTSDAGYLQSVYELAFLPRFTDLQNYGNNQVCGNMVMLNGSFTEFKNSPTDVLNNNLMWRSYHPYATDSGAARDPFEDLKIVNDGGGFRINPYTEDLNVLMGAFANTPVDWWAASTTTEESGNANGKMQYLRQNEKLDAQQFNQGFAFNEFNADAKFKWVDLENVAKRFRDLVRQRMTNKGEKATADTWMDVFDGVEYSGRPTGRDDDPDKMTQVEELQENDCMDWDNPNFCNITMTGTDKLYDVDRKFLYGYWRECFAAKQQLFLVFVRAEPMMMGGGAKGATPPQLGARAVALVWRDPTASPDDKTPHRTRVLFYRQFD